MVALVAVFAIQYFRSSGSQPAKELTSDAIPIAAAYAHDVVSAERCKNARALADPATSNPCDVFATLQGLRVSGAGVILRGCDDVTHKVSNIDRLRDHDCVSVAVVALKRRGHLYVWLERHSGGWRVAAAVSLVQHLS